MRIISYILIALATSLVSEVWGQTAKNVKFDPVNQLKELDRYNPVEKTYLHFDKACYVGGDTIYYKAYVTLGNKHCLSELSEVLHIELIGPDKTVYKSELLHLIHGIAWGDFTLPAVLQKGTYHVKAYTKWMLNEKQYIFDKTLQIGAALYLNESPAATKIPRAVPHHEEVQFFPEGGELLSGINNKVAFKALDMNGLGTSIKGALFDQDGKVIVTFSDSHLGMGSFSFEPEANKIYTVQVKFGTGQRRIDTLPKVNTYGIHLRLTENLPEAVTISANSTQAFYSQNKDKTFSIIVYAGGIPIELKARLTSQQLNFRLKKQNFPTGILQITLFSSENEPLSERLIFIRNNDMLDLTMQTDKQVYQRRQAVNILVSPKNANADTCLAHLSVAVINETALPESRNSEASILSTLLLTSELKGFIEQPDYYFDNPTAQIDNDLDLVMLTNGYRRYVWKKLMNENIKIPSFKAETAIGITGTVVSANGSLLKNTAVYLIDPTESQPEIRQYTDSLGRFNFEHLMYKDSTLFYLRTANKNARIKLDDAKNKIPAGEQETPNNEPVDKSANDVLAKIANRQITLSDPIAGNHLLKTVTIKGSRPSTENYRTTSLAGAGNADQVMHASEIEKIQGPLSTSLNGRLRGVLFINDVPYLTLNAMSTVGDHRSTLPMTLVVDGLVISPDIPNAVNIIQSTMRGLQVNAVENIEVLKYASTSIYGMAGAGGVLVITTRQTYQINETEKIMPNTLRTTPQGFYKARLFYSPQYNAIESPSSHKDQRTTIYWLPELKIGHGNDGSFKFFNSDEPGTYKVIVEGVDTMGHLARSVTRYQVN